MTLRTTGQMPWGEGDRSLASRVTDPRADAEVGDALSVEPAIATRTCSRCRKTFETFERKCPYCGARNAEATGGEPAEPAATGGDLDVRSLKIVIIAYAAILFQSVLFAVADAAGGGVFEFDVVRTLTVMSILEAIDTAIVVIAAGLLFRLPRPADPVQPVGAWVLAWPALAAGLALNILYHRWMEGLGIPVMKLPVDLTDGGLVLWGLLVVCVQPALIEEWFFRGVIWKTLREHVGRHGTVWVVAIMFGIAHIGAFLSVPILILIGALLGYARLYSGGLALPILLHFVHNLVVSLWDAGA